MGEAGPGESPKQSQAVPFVAEEICRGRQRSRFSMPVIGKRISMKVLDMKYSGLVYVWGGLEGR
jgi:hypothetical protein